MIRHGQTVDYTLVLRSGAPLRRVAYDLNGNTQTRYVAGEGTYSYSYDYKSWLVGMTYPNQTRAGFVYNGDGLRIKAREPDSAEEDYFLYDGVRPYARVESAQGGARAVYVSEGGSYYSPIVTLRTANANWTYLRDGMESVRKILNDSQTTTDAYTFEAFGNPTGQAGTTVNPFRYVGALGYYWFDFAHHGRDRTTSLRLLGARYYGPSPRRFWTQDRVPAELNRYAYVSNNPLTFIDPEGMRASDLHCDHLREQIRRIVRQIESRGDKSACGELNTLVWTLGHECADHRFDDTYRADCKPEPPCPHGGGPMLGRPRRPPWEPFPKY